MSDKPLTDICFENFDLHPKLLQGLEDAQFIRCTPIQAMTLPVTLARKDVAGQAQTGTGKTAAFLVATFNHLLNNNEQSYQEHHDPRAVIIAPTRELAVQIDKDARQIGRHTGISTALIYGGVDYDKQRRQLEDGVDIVIATPGRLIDFVKQGAVKFHRIEIMILDEADRMFDLGFIKDIRYLFRRMPSPDKRQNLLFSATLSHRVLELAYEHMNEPEKLVVESDTITAAEVRQTVYFPATEEKLPLLLGILAGMDANRSMVFVNTKIACERVARTLERAGYRVGVLSGDVPQKKREKLLSRFKSGELGMLVATDVAARGLHIPGVSHVFNYDLPFDAEDYVHRIGRTARLGEQGDAISFACDEYAMSLPDIEAYIEQKIPVTQLDPKILQEVPTKRRAPVDGGPSESIVEEAIADASAERKRRRDRDRKDGRSGSRPPQRKRSGNNRARAAHGQSPASSGEQGAPNKRSKASRKRRSNTGNNRPAHHHSSARSENKHAAPAQTRRGNNGTRHKPSAAPAPTLQLRIVKTIKSLASRLGMRGDA